MYVNMRCIGTYPVAFSLFLILSEAELRGGSCGCSLKVHDACCCVPHGPVMY